MTHLVYKVENYKFFILTDNTGHRLYKCGHCGRYMMDQNECREHIKILKFGHLHDDSEFVYHAWK